MINDIIDIKQKNVKDVIKCIRFSDDLTKKDISQRTGLSFSTVSNICNALKSKGVVDEVKDVNNYSVGRTPHFIRLNYDRFFVLCLDLQLEGFLKMALMDLRYNIVFKHEEYALIFKDASEIISYSYEKFKYYVGKLGVITDNIIGVGAAISGIFDTEKETVVSCAVPMFENQPLKRMISELYGMPAYVDNESNLSVIAVSAQEGLDKNIVYVYIGEGTGLGVIVDGVLLRGHRGYGAEIGHIPIGRLRKVCESCGSYNCVETDLSIKGFLYKYYGRDGLKDISAGWNKFVSSVLSEEKKALEVINENGTILGELVSILVNMFDPSVVYIGGVITPIFDKLLPFVQAEVEKRLVVRGSEVPPIKCDYESDYSMFKGSCEILVEKWNPI
ncbi:putative NBD/HSP70 family sugar kinase [Caldicoprobacter guelmensis]|nr:putative NBD/HSP70 family sugar kinase [Caldicoprobacter guelmensis]